MTSATAPSLTLVTSSLDHPDARKLASQLDGELANIYGGPNTGRDTAVSANLAAPRGLFLIGYLDDVAVACGGVRLRRDLPHAELTAEIKRMYVAPEARGRRHTSGPGSRDPLTRRDPAVYGSRLRDDRALLRSIPRLPHQQRVQPAAVTRSNPVSWQRLVRVSAAIFLGGVKW